MLYSADHKGDLFYRFTETDQIRAKRGPTLHRQEGDENTDPLKRFRLTVVPESISLAHSEAGLAVGVAFHTARCIAPVQSRRTASDASLDRPAF